MTGESAVSAERLVCELEPALPSVAVGRNEVRVSASGTRTQVDPKERARLRGSTPQELKRLLRGDLDTVVMTALHKDATRRYQSVEQFAADLERHLTGYPILARKDSFGYRAAKFYKRHRLGVVMGAVALLSLFVGVAGVVYGYVRARHETRVAQLEALKASEINDFLHEMLSAADPEEGRTDVTVREVLDASSDRVDTELSALPEVRAALHQTIGETYVNLGLHAQAEPHLRHCGCASWKVRRILRHPVRRCSRWGARCAWRATMKKPGAFSKTHCAGARRWGMRGSRWTFGV